jgi:hypothetical protein
MTNGFIALMLGVGVSGWVYSKMMRQTGNNTKNSLTVAGIVAVIAFFIMLYVLSLVPKS